MPSSQREPNRLLRQQRLEQGWTLEQAAAELSRLCGSEGSARVNIDAKMIGRWERGEHLPSLYYQKKLSQLYGKLLHELGFIQAWRAREEQVDAPAAVPARFPPLVPQSTQQLAPIDLAPREAIDLLHDAPHLTLDQLPGAWLALGAADLATLFRLGWTLEEVLTSLRIVLEGVHPMPNLSRRTFGRRIFELGATAVISGVPVPTDKQLSAEERMQLQEALGTSLVAGWKLFHTAGNAQVLAVGQAQLLLLQQNHTWLPSRVRAGFYTSVYNLIGKASHFQGRYEDALEAHQNAHVAALATGDPWNVAQSLICQADSYQALGQHAAAIDAIEEALRLLDYHAEDELLRSKAQLLASWVENALEMKEWRTAEEKLEDAAGLLDRLPPHEQFDRASWLQLAGKHAFAVGDYHRAVEHLEAALRVVPPTWLVRQVLILLPLVAAHTWERDREASLAASEGAFAAVKALNAPTVTQPYRVSLQGLLEAFPHDISVKTFVAEKLTEL
jgi:tetratricopeptide (TPR) repeat protein